MTAHLAGTSGMVEPGAQAVVILGRAEWPMSKPLVVPGDITLLPLPPRSPELNPAENIRQSIRDNRLSTRVFASHDDIVALSCLAWNRLIDRPWKIMTIGHRDWAHEF